MALPSLEGYAKRGVGLKPVRKFFISNSEEIENKKMNNDFEKYLENFTPIPPSGEFRQKTLAASRQAWKARAASSSVFSFLFSPRSLLWAQAAMVAVAVALVCVENKRTEQFLAGTHGEAANGTADEIKFFSELGLDKTYSKRVIAFKKMYAANDPKPINFAAYQKTINTIIEEGIIQ